MTHTTTLRNRTAPLRNILRNGTADLHEAVDTNMSRYDLGSRAGYAAFLQCHSKVLFAAEASLLTDSHFDTIPYARERLRSGALRRDLETMGVGAADGATVSMSFLNARSAIIGITYVLEGSRLGAKILLKRVATQFEATEFLRHGGTLPLWPTYLQWLQEQDLDRTETARAVEAARAVFHAYLDA